MRIGIDMRMAGTGEGIARYSEELVKQLAETDNSNDYFLVYHERANPDIKIQNPKFRIVRARTSYYSWAEQTRFIGELRKLNLDLVHFTNFNFPVFYRGKFVVTIHDLIHHQFPGKKKSRFFHRLAYRLTIRSAIKHAEKVIAVSEATKKDILRSFNAESDKVSVIYEGVDKRFFEQLEPAKIARIKEKYQITKPYLLFVGVWRQYKNLPILAQAFDILKIEYRQDYELVLAGKIDLFYPEIRDKVFSIKSSADIKALGYVPDEDLPALYQGAAAFVLPSLVEGFGLIAVEAQASGVPVVASDIPVLREVLGKSAIYFDPQNSGDLANRINLVLNDPNRNQMITLGRENAKRFDWANAAQQTLEIYRKAT